MKREFEVLTDIYNEAGKCLKKDVTYFKLFETDEIELENYIDAKGKVVNKYSGVLYRDKYYKVNIPYSEMKVYVSPLIIKGLMDKSTYNEKIKSKVTKARTTRGGRSNT